MKNKIILFLLAFVFIQNAKAGTRREPFLLIADEQYQSGIPNAGVWVTIEYVVDGHLRKPFIVFEGFDPGIYSSPNVKSGRKGIADFIYDINDDAPDNVALPLRDKLQGSSQEYDIVYVDLGKWHRFF